MRLALCAKPLCVRSVVPAFFRDTEDTELFTEDTELFTEDTEPMFYFHSVTSVTFSAFSVSQNVLSDTEKLARSANQVRPYGLKIRALSRYFVGITPPRETLLREHSQLGKLVLL